jgi:hypothetical protein
MEISVERADDCSLLLLAISVCFNFSQLYFCCFDIISRVHNILG